MTRRFILVALLYRVGLLSTVLLCACSSTPTQYPAVNTLYCDRYLFYPMCALDITNNGVTDFVYFEDSQQIFLFNQQLVSRKPDHLMLHECAQSMDKPLINATSQLLTVSDNTNFLRRSEIKNGIFYHYMRYLPRINRCNRALQTYDENREDDFGVAENSDF